jgi:membrane peptidoglycan carboxypeptidase
VFGATYPAHIWAQFMEAALAKDPIVDFVAPNEKLWPTPQFIDEYGRHYSTYYAQPAPPTTPTTLGPIVTTTTKPGKHGSTTTVPPIVPPTTAPPPTSTSPPSTSTPVTTPGT